MKILSKGKYSRGYEINIDEDNGAITSLYDNKDFPKFNIINNGKIFGSVCYTLKTDDITKGEKPPLTPFIDRQALFDNIFNSPSGLVKQCKERGIGFIAMKALSDGLIQCYVNVD